LVFDGNRANPSRVERRLFSRILERCLSTEMERRHCRSPHKESHPCFIHSAGNPFRFLDFEFANYHMLRNVNMNNWIEFPRFALCPG
jgi:hypothetical protein